MGHTELWCSGTLPGSNQALKGALGNHHTPEIDLCRLAWITMNEEGKIGERKKKIRALEAKGEQHKPLKNGKSDAKAEDKGVAQTQNSNL